MNTKFNKYRRSIYFLIVIYLNLFFYSSYTHHHHDVQSFDEDVVLLHTHIFDGYEKDHDHDEEENHLENESSHEHLTFNTTFQFIRIAKTLSNILSYEPYSIVDCQYKTLDCESETRIVTDFPSKLHWERYVHTASNLSPPSV
jgi:hypothetical protein